MEQYEGGIFGNLSRRPGMAILFPLTVESLEAIMVGLEPGPDDEILAVGGCGDQAFALLEKAGKVVIADVNEAQLKLIRKRKDALAAKDYKTFFLPTGTDYEFSGSFYRVRYFEVGGRLVPIQERHSNLEISEPMSIEDHARDRTFTKIYASDAMGELYSNQPLDVQLSLVLRGLEMGGLIYISNGAEINNLVPDISPLGIQLVPELTERAQAAEKTYTPNVYRKVSFGK